MSALPTEGSEAVVIEPSDDAAALRFSLTAAHTSGAFALAQGCFQPGCGAPPHRHSFESETFHIVEGCMRFEVGDRTVDAGEGVSVHLPAGVPHAFRNVSGAPCRFVLVVAPAGLEAFFAEAALLAEAQAPASEFEALAAAYGLECAAEWYESRSNGRFQFEV